MFLREMPMEVHVRLEARYRPFGHVTYGTSGWLPEVTKFRYGLAPFCTFLRWSGFPADGTL